jgi:hypothetical protein
MASAEVDAWFSSSDHPLKDAMLRVREIILAADGRITESIKWKSPTFSFEGNIASFNPNTKKHVSLMFHQGASIPGEHPKLEGGSETVRYMRFADADDVERSRADVEAVIRAWCEMKSRE